MQIQRIFFIDTMQQIKEPISDPAMEAIEAATGAILTISKTLLSLKDKRVTLEEKMIRTYLHGLAEGLASTLASLHKHYKDKNYDIEPGLINEFKQLALEIKTVSDSLAKIVDYNWNFLEQYFEHDFYSRLVNEHKFADRLETVSKAFRSQL